MSRLRLSSHQLKIETGRYAQNRIERNLRYCTICNSNEIEDEFHFVIMCPSYRELRKKFIKSYYYKKPSMLKFIELLQNKTFPVLLNLCKFIQQAFNVRSSLSIQNV